MTASGVRTATGNPWAAHRSRAEALRNRFGYAADLVTLYLALLEAWTEAWRAAGQWSARRAIQPAGDELAAWAAERALPPVVAVTARFGPDPLAAAVTERSASGDVEPLLIAWLSGAQPDPVERYLARAVLRGPLEAVDAAGACAGDPSPRGGRTCPTCGGRPQLSYRTVGDDALVAGRRYLLCERCAGTWAYTGNACAGCGETAGSRRTVFAERRGGPVVGRPGPTNDENDAPLLPHLRVEACDRCSRYLIDVDLGQDARAVPEVDELTALPLDLFATERGLTKVAPNLMGF